MTQKRLFLLGCGDTELHAKDITIKLFLKFLYILDNVVQLDTHNLSIPPQKNLQI